MRFDPKLNPRLLENRGEIADLTNDRLTDERSFTLPEHWRDERVQLDLTRRYTVSSPVSLLGRATFGGRPARVEICPVHCESPKILPISCFCFSRSGLLADPAESMAATLDNSNTGAHNINIGGVGIVEHATALTAGAGIVGEFRLTAKNFPSFPNCTYEMFQAMYPLLVVCGWAEQVSVPKPFAMRFDNGAYAAIEPDAGSGTLTIDHQIDHRGNCLGVQRVVWEVSPQTFAYLARARPMTYGWKAWVMDNLARHMPERRLWYTGLTCDNLVIVRNRILNPRPEFEARGTNWEPLMHELVDKLGALALVLGRLAGRVTFFRTSHFQDVQFAHQLMTRLA